MIGLSAPTPRAAVPLETRSYTSDNKAPEIDLSGRLGAFALESSIYGGAEPRVVATDAPFRITAHDGSPGSPATEQSGVSWISAQLYSADPQTGGFDTSRVVKNFDDGNTPAGPKHSPATCDPAQTPGASSCNLSYSGVINAGPGSSALTPGIYYLFVNANDYTGHVASKLFKFGVGVATIDSLFEGQATARYVPVTVSRTRGSATAMRLQYRVASSLQWCDAPPATVRKLSDQSVIGGWPVALSGSTSADLVVDLDALRIGDTACLPTATPLADGEVRLRALMEGSEPAFARSSEDVTVVYDRGGRSTEDDSEQLGPGAVDLVSGNFSLSATDVSVDAYKSDLTVSRTYNSRYSDQSSLLGPGWQLGLPVESAGASYRRVIDNADVRLNEQDRYPSVDVETNDGDYITFELSDSPYANGADRYFAPGYADTLELRRIPDPYDATRTAGFTLKDLDSGTVVGFKTADSSMTAGAWLATDVSTPGLSDAVTYKYTYDSAGKANIDTMFAPVGSSGVVCGADFATIARGCQALKFSYINVNGKPNVRRLRLVTLRTWDPALNAMRSVDVAVYTYDPQGRLVSEQDPRLPSAIYTQYAYGANGSSQLLTSIVPPNEQPFSLSYLSLPEDNKPGRLEKVSRSALAAGTAVWNVRYYVPTNPAVNAAAPYDFSAGKVAEWGQAKPPWIATAVFTPDQPPNGSPATNYGNAALSYLDPVGREVNSANPGGRIDVTEYDVKSNVVRTLSAENRARAMAESTPSARLADAQKWDARKTYVPVPGSLDGRTHLSETVGPEHQVRLDDNSQVTGRTHARFTYDQGSPIAGDNTKEPFDLITTKRESLLASGTDYDVRTATMNYGATEAEWKLRAARTTTTDPGGLNIVRKVNLNADGFETERFQPRSQSLSEPSTTKTIYYVAGTDSGDNDCNGKAEWIGLPCKVGPGIQPTAAGMPKLPVQKITYNYPRQPSGSVETVTDAAGSQQTRSTVKTYDDAGRLLTEAVTGSVGAAIKTTKHLYSNLTGRETETQSLNGDGTVAKRVTRMFDSLGQLASYADSEGHSSLVAYDLLGRVSATYDGRATRTNGYDPVTGDLTVVAEEGVGTFNGAYNADGALVAETLPGGVVRGRQTDATGSTTYMSYNRTANCTTGCLMYDNFALGNAHGQIAGLWTTMAGQDPTAQIYDYDAAGRLTRTQDDRFVSGVTKCELRDYAYDADSNRLSKQTRPEPSSGCDWSGAGTTQSNTFDNADRLRNSGYTYDAFGRTTTVPQADAGGGSNVTSTYYVNDLAQSVTEAGTTQTLDLDPMLRVGRKVKTGGTSSTEIYAYSDDSDAPAWTQTGNAWTRNIAGLGGDLEVIQDSSAGVRLQIQNIRGDVVAQSTTDGTLSNITNVDEFGVPKTAMPAGTKYAFHGSKRREALTAGGVVAMGVRLYAPRQGRFLQVDPVPGGTANPYEYPSDPINSADLDGKKKYTLEGSLRVKLGRKYATQLINALRSKNAETVKNVLTGIVGGLIGAEIGGAPGAVVGVLTGAIVGILTDHLLAQGVDALKADLNRTSNGKHSHGVVFRAFVRITVDVKVIPPSVNIDTDSGFHSYGCYNCKKNTHKVTGNLKFIS
ncbi:MAG: RHS repeat-associated core domain-containing protein [Solirubrobacterales bacterium]